MAYLLAGIVCQCWRGPKSLRGRTSATVRNPSLPSVPLDK